MTVTAAPDNGYRLKSIRATYQRVEPVEEGLGSWDNPRVGKYFTVRAGKRTTSGWNLNIDNPKVWRTGRKESTVTVSANAGTGATITSITFSFNGRALGYDPSASAGEISEDGSNLYVRNIDHASTVTLHGPRTGQLWNLDSAYIWGTMPMEKELVMTPAANANEYTFTMPDADVTISAEFERFIDVSGITLSESGAELTVGDAMALTAAFTPQDATDQTVTWSVAGTDADAVMLYTDAACTAQVGTVATSALTVYAKGMTPGSAIVAATAANGTIDTGDDKAAACTVTVKKRIAYDAEDVDAVYDNAAHGIMVSVSDPSAGATVRYGTEEGKYAQTVSPTITNVNDSPLTVYYQITADGYRDATGYATVTITAADPATPTGLTAIYGQTLADVKLPKGWAWQDEATSVGNAGTQNHQANYHDPSGNHADQNSMAVSVTVGKAWPRMTAPLAVTGLTYTGKPQALVSAGSTACGAMQYSIDQGNTWSDTVPSGTSAGNYKVFYRVVGDENHKDTGMLGPVTVFVAKASLTLRANNHTIVYGDAPANNGAEITGFVNSEDESVLSGELSYIYSYSQFGKPGRYMIIPRGLKADNYKVNLLPGTLTVERIEIGLAWGDASFTFDGSRHAPTVAATGLLDEDEGGVTVTVRGAQTDAGSYTATAVMNGDRAVCYRLPVDHSQAFTIGKGSLPFTELTIPRSVPVNATEATSFINVMDGDAKVQEYQVGNPQITGSATVVGNSVDHEHGTLTTTLSGGLAGDEIVIPVTIVSQNYQNTTVNVKIIITDMTNAGVAISGEGIQDTGFTKTYGDPDFTLAATTAKPGTDGTGAWSWTSSNENVATVDAEGTVTIRNRGTTVIAANYTSDNTVGQAEVTLTVQPKSLEGAEVWCEHPYTGQPWSPVPGDVAVTLDNVTLGEGDYSVSVAGTENTDADEYGLTVAGSGNYTGSVTGSYFIAPAVLTITTDSAEKAYDGSPLTNGNFIVSGLADGQTITVSITGSQTTVGSSQNFVEIDWGTVERNNYTVAWELGTLTVQPKSIADASVILDSTSLEYLGSEQHVTVTEATLDGQELNPGDYVISGTTAATETGMYAVSVTGRDNYTGTATAYWRIGQITLGNPDFAMPAALTTIEAEAFEGVAMTVVDAHSVTAIGENAFRNCGGLRRIRLPKNCAIDETAFAGCGTIYVFAPAGGTTQAFCQSPDNSCMFVAEAAD